MIAPFPDSKSREQERTWELFPIAVGVFCVKLWVEDIPVVIQRSQTAIHQIGKLCSGASGRREELKYSSGSYKCGI